MNYEKIDGGAQELTLKERKTGNNRVKNRKFKQRTVLYPHDLGRYVGKRKRFGDAASGCRQRAALD